MPFSTTKPRFYPTTKKKMGGKLALPALWFLFSPPPLNGVDRFVKRGWHNNPAPRLRGAVQSIERAQPILGRAVNQHSPLRVERCGLEPQVQKIPVPHKRVNPPDEVNTATSPEVAHILRCPRPPREADTNGIRRVVNRRHRNIGSPKEGALVAGCGVDIHRLPSFLRRAFKLQPELAPLLELFPLGLLNGMPFGDLLLRFAHVRRNRNMNDQCLPAPAQQDERQKKAQNICFFHGAFSLSTLIIANLKPFVNPVVKNGIAL